jgi:glycosyltransferase involved in cell wall biosynthesis
VFPHYVHPIKRAYLNWALPRSVRQATMVAVPTQFVRNAVIDTYGVDAAKVVVVSHGIEPNLGQGATSPEVLRQKFGLGTGPIVVLPAMTHPHKGHAFAVRLMAEYWTDPELRLVLTGGEGAAEGQVRELIAQLGQTQRVLRVGRVSAQDRDGLLHMADAMVFPSEFEGFGAPVIEAMALRTPVLCSDQACLPEVVGDAGEIVPLQLQAWAPALDRVRARRQELILAGTRRVAQFSTARSAEMLVEAYEAVLR